MKTLLISSAMPREGKSTTTVNLAQALAERGQTVFLVESDLRRPTVAKMLSLEGEAGLGTLLAERSALSRELLSQVLQPAKQSSLFVIGSGPTPDNPTALLASPSMDQLLSYLDVQAQTTLLDAPPVLGLADVSVLAPKVDGVILVVAKGVATRESLRDALKQLQAARANVVGFVFLQKSRKDWGYN
jgi:capsular exopolysaccharide synthesis family protein